MYDRIVVPLDGSDLASEALVHGKNLAKRLDVPIHLVRAIDPTVFSGGMGAIGMGFDYTAVNELISEEEQDATSFIDTQVAALTSEGYTATGVVLRGTAATAIISATKDGDLVTMASHGRTGVRRWFLGSVAEEVLRQATVPVLLIRMPHEDEEKRH
ncbi:MAG: universal stress protein [Chloroflexota bacterium]|nr:universal stress protein [Chloroflexota bacterium]